MTIKEYIEKDMQEHPEIADRRIIIEAAYTADPCDPWREPVYEGLIKDVPEDLLAEEILESGWSVGRQTVTVTVLREHPVWSHSLVINEDPMPAEEADIIREMQLSNPKKEKSR